MDKGVLRNTSTKISESMHGPLRKIYLQQTNFKNVEAQVLSIQQQAYFSDANDCALFHHQILSIEHYKFVALGVREQITALDEAKGSDGLSTNTPVEEDDDGYDSDNTVRTENFKLGSPEKACTFDGLEQLRKGNRAFDSFRTRLQAFFRSNIPLWEFQGREFAQQRREWASKSRPVPLDKSAQVSSPPPFLLPQ